jgi:hypothetical protein
LQAGVFGRCAARPTRHSERHQARALEGGRRREYRIVGRVRARPAGLDVIDAEVVQLVRDGQLVADREVDALRLLAVAQRAVVEKDARRGHGELTRKSKGGPAFYAPRV